jgi:hypothetical protein
MCRAVAKNQVWLLACTERNVSDDLEGITIETIRTDQKAYRLSKSVHMCIVAQAKQWDGGRDES